jgi:glycine hydroxymethyltransferase
MLIDLRNKGLTGKAAQLALDKANITCNKNAVPFDDKSPLITSGIRLGTPALTTRGMRETEMKTVAALIAKLLSSIDDESNIAEVKQGVIELCSRFSAHVLK